MPGDPLAQALQGAGTKVGAIAIGFATRRRSNGMVRGIPTASTCGPTTNIHELE